MAYLHNLLKHSILFDFKIFINSFQITIIPILTYV